MAVVTIPYPNFIPNTVIASAQTNANNAAFLAYLNNGSGSFAAAGYNILPGGLYIQWATVANVAADGSAATATSFPIAFPTACFVVIPVPKNVYQTNAWQLSAQYDTPTTTGCNLNVSGAPAGQTVSVSYIALGN